MFMYNAASMPALISELVLHILLSPLLTVFSSRHRIFTEFVIIFIARSLTRVSKSCRSIQDTWRFHATRWPDEAATWPDYAATWPCQATTWPGQATTWPDEATTWPGQATTWKEATSRVTVMLTSGIVKSLENGTLRIRSQ